MGGRRTQEPSNGALGMTPNWTVARASWLWLVLAGCSSEPGAPGSVDPFMGPPNASGGAAGNPAMAPAGTAGSGSVSETPVTPILQPMPPVVPPVSGDCTVPPPPSELIGWASEGTGTTGGGNAAPVVVTTADELVDLAA